MKSHTLSTLEQEALKIHFEELKRVHPMPWVLDACNRDFVCVKDSKGDIVFIENFHETSTSEESYIQGKALALFLVAISTTGI